MMTDKEAIELFEKTHFIKEQSDMQKNIDIIRDVLSQNPIIMSQVRKQIDTINEKHPENLVIFNLVFPPQGKRVSLDSAPNESLISDLMWKLNYLQAKKTGKLFEEFCKTMRSITQEDHIGGQK